MPNIGIGFDFVITDIEIVDIHFITFSPLNNDHCEASHGNIGDENEDPDGDVESVKEIKQVPAMRMFSTREKGIPLHYIRSCLIKIENSICIKLFTCLLP